MFLQFSLSLHDTVFGAQVESPGDKNGLQGLLTGAGEVLLVQVTDYSIIVRFREHWKYLFFISF